MSKFVLDTNIYIEAARSAKKAEELKNFVSAFLPFIYLHAVVVQELLAGATSARATGEIEKSLVTPFEKRGRLIIPAWRAWKRSGQMVAELIARKSLSPGGQTRSFLNDALIAASLREEGSTIITRNIEDFRLLSKVETFRFLEPWPKARQP
ncbi:MAG: type II toxin-antitoxin system VapC family toxin [Vicinamibacteria bacterium]